MINGARRTDQRSTRLPLQANNFATSQHLRSRVVDARLTTLYARRAIRPKTGRFVNTKRDPVLLDLVGPNGDSQSTTHPDTLRILPGTRRNPGTDPRITPDLRPNAVTIREASPRRAKLVRHLSTRTVVRNREALRNDIQTMKHFKLFYPLSGPTKELGKGSPSYFQPEIMGSQFYFH